MIATRFNPLGIKPKPTAKSYIQDGLIAQWDAIENVGYGLHDGNATMWKDLVGSRDMTCVNVKWENNLAVFDGTAGATNIDGAILVESGRTLYATLLAEGDLTNKHFISVSHNDYVTVEGLYPFRACITTYNGRFIVAAGRNYSTRPKFIPPDLSTLKTLAFTYYENNILDGYGNGIALTKDGSDYRINGTTEGISVGCASMNDLTTPAYPSKIRVANVLLYNRVLAQEEIEALTSIDKERFGV